jgi:DNA-binding transcriptional MerR regulator
MEDLISKKEVLEQYGISYGALYRWKRMGLIPEAWFIRKSTTTGQETFFRRDQICPRLELILSRRDGTSLEKLAGELEGAAAAPLCQTACGRGPVRPAGIYRGGNPKRPPDRRGTGK